MKKPNVFIFTQLSLLVGAWLEWLKYKNPKFSTRWLSKRLGLKTHSHISRIVSGQKSASRHLISQFCRLMELTVDETAYVHALSEFSKVKSAEKREYLLQRIEKMRIKESDFLLTEEHFEVIAHWYHLTILEMLSLKDFQNDTKWIVQRLGSSITEEVVEKVFWL